MPYTTKFKQQLKAKAHKLKPIVIVGNNGFTESVKKEIERGLIDHELIKIRINAADKKNARRITGRNL
jgi:RNA-binding protein